MIRKIFSSHSQMRIRLLIVVLVILASSCKKLVEVPDPSYSVDEQNVYQSNATAIAVMTGIYGNMSSPNSYYFTGNQGVAVLLGLCSDELTLDNSILTGNLVSYYSNTLGNANPSFGTELWNPLFNYIFTCNSVLQGVSASTTISLAVKQQLLGEAKFMRAFCFFYLENLYGNIPMPLSSDFASTRSLPASSADQVYHQIIADLKDAKGLLSQDYLDASLTTATNERVRPTKWVASALLARTYLAKKDFPNAEAEADSIIGNGNLFSLDSLNGVFLKNSNETIWQLQPVISGHNTEDAQTFILTTDGPDANLHPVSCSPQLLASFEPGDQRRVNWIDCVTVLGVNYYFSFKYKSIDPTSVTEYFTVFRLAEQFLIRAEARLMQANIAGAQDDLNVVRKRAALSATSSGDQSSLSAAILHERQVELFTEWGHRWLDLKRTGMIDQVMNVVTPEKSKIGSWMSYQQLFPLPLSDVQEDLNLKQNAGYN